MDQIAATHFGFVTLTPESVDINVVNAAIREARSNIIEGAYSVERTLSEIIAHYFQPGDQARRVEFRQIVLESDWCSFSAKQKLVEWIINSKSLLTGKEFGDYQKLLKDVMSLRNAFTHGILSWSAGSVWLAYFEGTPIEKELTDEYLRKVQQDLRKAFDDLQSLGIKSGAIKLTTPSNDDLAAT